MDKCETCYAKDMEPYEIDNPCWNCKDGHSEWAPKPMTNADRIRAMSDEELAEFLSDFKDCAKNCLVGKGVKECSGLCATKDTLAVWLRLVAV